MIQEVENRIFGEIPTARVSFDYEGEETQFTLDKAINVLCLDWWKKEEEIRDRHKDHVFYHAINNRASRILQDLFPDYINKVEFGPKDNVFDDPIFRAKVQAFIRSRSSNEVDSQRMYVDQGVRFEESLGLFEARVKFDIVYLITPTGGDESDFQTINRRTIWSPTIRGGKIEGYVSLPHLEDVSVYASLLSESLLYEEALSFDSLKNQNRDFIGRIGTTLNDGRKTYMKIKNPTRERMHEAAIEGAKFIIASMDCKDEFEKAAQHYSNASTMQRSLLPNDNVKEYFCALRKARIGYCRNPLRFARSRVTTAIRKELANVDDVLDGLRSKLPLGIQDYLWRANPSQNT